MLSSIYFDNRWGVWIKKFEHTYWYHISFVNNCSTLPIPYHCKHKKTHTQINIKTTESSDPMAYGWNLSNTYDTNGIKYHKQLYDLINLRHKILRRIKHTIWQMWVWGDHEPHTTGLFISKIHYDVIRWTHFPRSWPFVRGIHRSHKGQWRGALVFSLICAWTNGWAKNRDADD